MNYSKLFLMMALGVSLNNVVCGMEQDDSNNKKRKREYDNSEQSKKNKKEYNKAATQELQSLLNDYSQTVSEEKIKELLDAGANPNIQNNNGKTPLRYAYIIRKKVVEILYFLMLVLTRIYKMILMIHYCIGLYTLTMKRSLICCLNMVLI